MTDDDNYTLIATLESWSLEVHNKANLPPRTKGITEGEKHGYYMQELAYNRVISLIKNRNRNQRPHMEMHERIAGENQWKTAKSEKV